MEGAIKSRLTELMHAADWNTVTERQLRNQVAEDLDVEAETYSQLIKASMTIYLPVHHPCGAAVPHAVPIVSDLASLCRTRCCTF